MKYFQVLICALLSLSLMCCAQDKRYVEAFSGTKAFELAKAVNRGDYNKMKKLVRKDSTLTEFANPVNGSNVLMLSIDVREYKSFKYLLELGANPNYTNPYTKHSVLIDACRPFGNVFEWTKDLRYAKLLLEYKADPNYAVKEEFVNERGITVRPTSPLMKASSLYLDLVQILIDYGADPNIRVGGEIPLGVAVSSSKFDIIYYYIDTLKIDVHQPMGINLRHPEKKRVKYYIQDYINGYMNYKPDSEGYKKKQKLIEHLKDKGVEFENYEYKLN